MSDLERSNRIFRDLRITEITMLCSGRDMASPVTSDLQAETLHDDAYYFIKSRKDGDPMLDLIVRCDIRDQGRPSFFVLFERSPKIGKRDEYNQFHTLPPIDTMERERDVERSFSRGMRSGLTFFRFSPMTEGLLRDGKTPQEIVERLNTEQVVSVCALSDWKHKGEQLDPEIIRIILMYLGIMDKNGNFTNKRGGGKRSYRNKSYKKKRKSRKQKKSRKSRKLRRNKH